MPEREKEVPSGTAHERELWQPEPASHFTQPVFRLSGSASNVVIVENTDSM